MHESARDLIKKKATKAEQNIDQLWSIFASEYSAVLDEDSYESLSRISTMVTALFRESHINDLSSRDHLQSR